MAASGTACYDDDFIIIIIIIKDVSTASSWTKQRHAARNIVTCRRVVSRRPAVWQCTVHRTYVDTTASWVASRRRNRSYRPETGRRSLPSVSCEQT